MARRNKKKKIRVDLHFPKDDNTRRNFLMISISSALLGIVFLAFWATTATVVTP